MRKEKLEELRSYIEELRTIEILEKRELKIINDKLENSFLRIKKLSCLLGNGEVITREQILKNSSDGSASIVLPLTPEENTILVVQPRVLTSSSIGIEFPAGYVEKGEDPMIAGRRELEEETGYSPKEMYHLASYYQDQGCSKAFNHSYLATGCIKKQNQHLDESEFIRYFECTYEEALWLADKGYINDANSLIALEKSKRYVRCI